MADNGIRSDNLPISTTPVEILGHDYVGSERRTVRIPVSALPGGGGSGSGDVGEFVEAVQALQTNFDEKEAAIDAAIVEQAELKERLDQHGAEVAALYPGMQERPGDRRELFTSSLTGAAASQEPIAFGETVAGEDGTVLRVTPTAPGPMIVASRVHIAVEPGQLYAARIAVRRFKNTSDPLGDTVQFALSCLNASKQKVSERVFWEGNVVKADGLVFKQVTFSLDRPEADITLSATTREVIAFTRLFGGDGVTDVSVIRQWETNGLIGPEGKTGDLTEAAKIAREDIIFAQQLVSEDATKVALDRAATETTLEAVTLAAKASGGFKAATLAAALTAGRAATANGQTFTATGDDVDYIGLYRRDSAAAQTEIAPYPKATGVVSGRNSPGLVDGRGYSAAIEDGAGRVFLAFDGEGKLIDAHGFIASLHEQLVVDTTSASVYDMALRAPIFQYSHWNGLTVMGQSNASGNNSGPITLDQPFNNKRLNGARTALVPLVESTFETTTAGASAHAKWRVLKDMRPWDTWVDYDWIAQNLGGGGAPFSLIKKGSTTYNNGLTRVAATKALATTAGKSYAERVIQFLHGETDAGEGMTQAAYLAEMIALKNDWNADVLPLTGQIDRIPMFVEQVAIGSSYTATNHATSLAMLEAAEIDPEIFVVVPGYALRFGGDGLHFDPYDERLAGEYFGKALHRYYIERRNPSTVRPVAWKIVDKRTIEVEFFVPVPPLVFDLETVWPGDLGLGFAIYNGAAEVAISDVRIVGGRRVWITTAADVSPGNEVTYAEKSYGGGGIGAGNRKGPRGNLRDSDRTIAYYPDRNGKPVRLPNWCAIFRKTLA